MLLFIALILLSQQIANTFGDEPLKGTVNANFKFDQLVPEDTVKKATKLNSDEVIDLHFTGDIGESKKIDLWNLKPTNDEYTWTRDESEGFVELSDGTNKVHLHTNKYYTFSPGASIEVEYQREAAKDGTVVKLQLVGLKSKHSLFYTLFNKAETKSSWITEVIPIPVEEDITAQVILSSFHLSPND